MGAEKMTVKITRTVFPKPPFDFELTAGYHTSFQGRYGTDSLDQGVYRRLLDLDHDLVLASVVSTGSVDSPRLEVELQGRDLTVRKAEVATGAVAWLLGADQDLAAGRRRAVSWGRWLSAGFRRRGPPSRGPPGCSGPIRPAGPA